MTAADSSTPPCRTGPACRRRALLVGGWVGGSVGGLAAGLTEALGTGASAAVDEDPGAAAPSPQPQAVPVLLYHRLAAQPLDSMTVRQARFEAHLALIDRLACTVLALADVAAWQRGERTLPARAVALCADDGHRSQFERLAPALRERGWPLTLFVYPSAISNAPYAMTWPQLQALAADSRVSVQSHTWWHPDFRRERERLAPPAFVAAVDRQLQHAKALLEHRLGRAVSLLAWPFGIADDLLAARAAAAGHDAAFVLGQRAVTRRDPPFALPRHLIVDGVDERLLGRRLEAAFAVAGRL